MRTLEDLPFGELISTDPRHAASISPLPGTSFQMEVSPQLPDRLARLDEIANNLWYSWDRPARLLFARLDADLWQSVAHSPKAFLKRIDQNKLDAAAEDPVFHGTYNRVLSAYDTYHGETKRAHGAERLKSDDLIAYFCAEFGFHESLPIYSGGLGILAGDHCKAASDMRLPFVGVGLLYRQGYFMQSIDNESRQHAVYHDAEFDDLPITPVTVKDGSSLILSVEMAGRTVKVKVWSARIGHVQLYLLDTDLKDNTIHDRDITHRLYGGDRTTRLEQEIILGVGGVRALAALGIKPTVWHTNEGHAAFLIIERMRALAVSGLSFDSALEAVAGNTVFTTHTAVPAGHDHFPDDVIRRYFAQTSADLKVDIERVLALGQTTDGPDFNMTALAIRGSRFHNGVSRIHGGVSKRICRGLWPQIEPAENPMSHVTNGVHVQTFLAHDWAELLDSFLGHGWAQRLTDKPCWQQIYNIPDLQFWSMRQSLKSQMFQLVRQRVGAQHARNQGSEAHLDRLLKLADPKNPNVLTIGFARRFATYKRATLLFQNIDWLRDILSDPKRPVLFLFAGKAHPADQPGQEFIRRIGEISRMPEFEGKVLLVEGYDLRLARRLVSGCDVWLNNPIYPLEASGTSGMKAAINGVLNLSVLDGWWDEGYDGMNGWAIKPAASSLDEHSRNIDEARTLYEILQDSVLPLYYNLCPQGYSPGWVEMAKHSIATLLPQFNNVRMLGEYLDRFYLRASEKWHELSAQKFQGARELALWKAKVRGAWQGVTVRRVDAPRRRLSFGETVTFEVAVRLNGLAPSDVAVELVLGVPRADRYPDRRRRLFLEYKGPLEGGEARYELKISPEHCGRIEYRLRAFPYNSMMTHPFEMGMMLWL